MIARKFFLIGLVFCSLSLLIQHAAFAGDCSFVWDTTWAYYDTALASRLFCDTINGPGSGVSATSETSKNQQSAYAFYQVMFAGEPAPTWREPDGEYRYSLSTGNSYYYTHEGMWVTVDGVWGQYNTEDMWYGDYCESYIYGTWDVVCECEQSSDCEDGYECVSGICEIIDNPPAIELGPFLAAGYWPLLSSSQASPTILKRNRNLLWTFSDDFASCSEDCTHTAEYQALGSDTWTQLDVTSDAVEGTAQVSLPVTSLQNATTYAFRFAVTDCAGQTTQSGEYYFRIATSDAPPAIESGPFLATGAWPQLANSASSALVLRQNYDVLWTFNDDYASCSGLWLCTHRSRYRKVGDTVWTWIPVSVDPEGIWYAYATLPVDSLDAGTYQFHFDVMDCAGQRTYAPWVYYFKVE
jgi:hypothetical protein